MEAQQGKVVAPLKFGSFFEGIHFEITNVILQIDRRSSAQIIVNTFRLLSLIHISKRERLEKESAQAGCRKQRESVLSLDWCQPDVRQTASGCCLKIPLS